MSDASEKFLATGIADLQRGKIEDAARSFEHAIALDPANAAAAANLGVALKALGRTGEAIEHLRRAAELTPEDASIWYNLGNALWARSDLGAASEAFGRALALNPDFGPAVFNLAHCRRDQGELERAVALYRRAVELMPRMAKARTFLARALGRLGDDDGALDQYQQAVRLAPEDAESRYDLALALGRNERYAEAEPQARAALGLDHRHRGALNILGVALQARGRDAEALLCLTQLLEFHPDDAEGLSNFGALLNKLGRAAEALEPLKKAVEIAPGMAMAQANLALSLNKLDRLTEAVERAERALAIEPRQKQAMMQLAYSLHYQGQLDDAIATYENIIKDDPSDLDAASNFLYLHTYGNRRAPDEIARRHLEWGERLGARIATRDSWPHRRDPDRPLRIGYLSADFRGHSVGLFLEPILRHHDRGRFEVFCYSNVVRPDGVTDRMKGMAQAWRDLRARNDEEAAATITRDRIDILIDLSGHTEGNRLPIFAMKPSPVQVSYLGYPNTTGLAAIDYYLTDRWIDPPGEHDDLFAETLHRLDRCKLCYKPREDLPDEGEPPALRNGYVSFGSFNNLVKYTPRVIELWAKVLEAVEDSRLVLKAKWFRDPSTRANFAARFKACGIGGDRVRLVDFRPEMDDIDIALDPFPFNGATTTCHALWMGLPPVALMGDAHSSRVTYSILAALGLEDLVAETPDDYVDKARELAGDLDGLSELRRTLRRRLLASPICDHAGFTHDLESAYRAMWRRWCEPTSVEPSRI